MLFQVLSINRLGELFFELSLLKVQGREVALSELNLNSSRFCKLGMKMGIKMGMIFPFLLTFYHKLVLREGVFGTAASLIRYFAIHKL